MANVNGEKVLMPSEEWIRFRETMLPTPALVEFTRVAFMAGMMASSDFFRMLIVEDLEDSAKHELFKNWFAELEVEIEFVRRIAVVLEREI